MSFTKHNPLMTALVVIAAFLMAALSTVAPAAASPTQSQGDGTVSTAQPPTAMPVADKKYNLGGKMYNRTGRIIYYARNYPSPTGFPSYDGVTYIDGWYSVGKRSNRDRQNRPVRWSLANRSWSKGGSPSANHNAPYNRYPYYHDVDGLFVPKRQWAQVMTETFWPSCMCYKPSHWKWLPGGSQGRWYKFWGPATARGGRYYVTNMHPY